MAFVALGTVCLAGVGARAQSTPPLPSTSGTQEVARAPGADAVPLAEGGSGIKDFAAGSSSSAESSLPDSPLPQLHKLSTPPATPQTAQRVASIYTGTIPAGYRAQPLTAHQKVVLGARSLYSFESLAAIVLSAGYSHITDGQPNYGVDSKAFAQRLGASAARETSQGVFTGIVLAPLLHEDPRYYVKGPDFNIIKRTTYAITRPLVTRTDGGRSRVNASLLIGYAGAAALTASYYPESNRNFHDVASTYGASIGGAALGFFVSEFSDDVLKVLHLKRFP